MDKRQRVPPQFKDFASHRRSPKMGVVARLMGGGAWPPVVKAATLPGRLPHLYIVAFSQHRSRQKLH